MLNMNKLFLVLITIVSQMALATGYHDIKNMAEFKNALKSSVPSVFMFSSPTCGPCQATKPHLTSAANKFKQAKFYVVDISKPSLHPLVKKYDIGGIPTIIYTKSGKEVKRDRRGAMTKSELYSSITDFLKEPKKVVKTEQKKAITKAAKKVK